jgi:hypothetical protein
VGIKGILTRPLPEWYVRFAATGGYSLNVPFLNFPFVGLFNDAIDGSSLWVYGLTASINTPSNRMWWNIEKGPNGTLLGQGTPVVSDVAALPGQIFYGAYTVLPTAATPFTWQSNTLQDSTLFPGFPLAVLRPGYQMSVTADAAPSAITGGFYWVALPGTAVVSG